MTMPTGRPQAVRVSTAAELPASMAERRGLQGRALVLVAIVLYAVALRPQLVSLGPLASFIGPDLGIPYAQVGLLQTIPLACMGLAALVVGFVVGRLGVLLSMDVSLALLVVFGLVRSTAGGAGEVLFWTLPIGIAIGLAGATLPIMVKQHLSAIPATATGVYTTAIQLGSTLSAALAVPLALALGGWRGALAAFAFAGGLSLVAWLLIMRGRRASFAADPHRPAAQGALHQDRERPGSTDAAPGARRPARLRWRDPVAWLLAILFWFSAFPFDGLLAWLAAAYVEQGWSEVAAGTLVALVGLAGLPASLIIGWAADRRGSRRSYLVGCSAVLVVATAGLVAVPSLAVAWALIAGAMLGAAFTLALMLPLDLAATPAAAAGLVGIMLAGGYLLTATTPWLLGYVRDATGSFTASLWLNVVASVLLLVVSLPFSRARMERWRLATG
jgi:CP family cyanate transporter-like MFS transporter